MNPAKTTDKTIRAALVDKLHDEHARDPKVRIINELGINHGSIRADIAVINGVMHAYEIKSDLDTLKRLHGQAEAYNEVFDKVTIVTGADHLYDVIESVPDWWGITIARLDNDGKLHLLSVRNAENNTSKNSISIARLLWRDEALAILEGIGEARGLRSKTRGQIYQKLASSVELDSLCTKVRETLFHRGAWRADQPLLIHGD
ncbi:sce7726 family protein [Candidatus Saccharibacteria bacterium]|nr:sce7726 family protein [Candidatus Saccharibacteria bacterium]